MYIGRYQGAPNDFTFDGDMVELIIFNTVLNATDLNDTGYYLVSKYGLTTEYVVPEPSSVLLIFSGLVGIL